MWWWCVKVGSGGAAGDVVVSSCRPGTPDTTLMQVVPYMCDQTAHDGIHCFLQPTPLLLPY